MFGCSVESHLAGRSLARVREGVFVTCIAGTSRNSADPMWPLARGDGWVQLPALGERQRVSQSSGRHITHVEGPDDFTVALRDISEREQVEVVPNAAQGHLEEIF